LARRVVLRTSVAGVIDGHRRSRATANDLSPRIAEPNTCGSSAVERSNMALISSSRSVLRPLAYGMRRCATCAVRALASSADSRTVRTPARASIEFSIGRRYAARASAKTVAMDASPLARCTATGSTTVTRAFGTRSARVTWRTASSPSDGNTCSM
jgi:hypothetical protein